MCDLGMTEKGHLEQSQCAPLPLLHQPIEVATGPAAETLLLAGKEGAAAAAAGSDGEL